MKRPNYSDQMALAMVESSRYSDNTREYPEGMEEIVKGDDGVVAEWFYPALNGQTDVSELRAILTYTSQNVLHGEEIGDLILGVAFVEMQHYDKLMEVVNLLGGKIGGMPHNIPIALGENAKEALELGIASEESSIDFYRKIKRQVLKSTESPTTRVIVTLLDKIIGDEQVHLNLFKEKLLEYEKASN